MITDILDVVAGPKQKSALSPKDDTKAAEDQATFADQLAANDRSDQEASDTETRSASEADRTDTQATLMALEPASDTETDADRPSAAAEIDVSFQVFNQTIAEETALEKTALEKTATVGTIATAPVDAPAMIDSEIIAPTTQTAETTAKVSDIPTASANEPTAPKAIGPEAAVREAAAPEATVPDPTINATNDKSADGQTGKTAPEQPALAAAASAQAQKAAGDAEIAKPTDTPAPGKVAEADIAHRTATAPPDSIANAQTLTQTGTALEDGLQTLAKSANSATVGEATGTGILTATTQTAASSSQAPTVQVAQTPATIPTPPQVVASPEDIPRLITQAMTADDAADRIVIQLDPPELGRVSVDFKLDANGVQTVTVTAETPEAIKKLRMMNFELIQAMEQNGLNSGGFGLDYQQSQQFTQYDPSQTFAEGGSETQGTDSVMRLSETALYHNPQAGQTGLNLKL